MTTIANFLATVSDNMPSDIADGSIINWINVLEVSIYTNIIKDLRLNKDAPIEFPELKTLDDTANQELDLVKKYGIQWKQLYEYYVYSQISILKEEFNKYNNYAALFQNMYYEFISFYYSNCHNPVAEARKGEFR